MININRSIFCLLLMVGINGEGLSADADAETFQCAIDDTAGEPISERLVSALVSGMPANYIVDARKYVDKVAPKDILIDVRNTDTNRHAIPVMISGALKIPLSQLKVKNYLKNKKLILVGDGLDNYFLEKEIDKLDSLGFSSVKILEYGIVSLIGGGQLQGGVVSSMQLRTSSSERLVAASIGADNHYLFLNIGEANDVYETLNLNSVHIPFENSDAFYTNLYAEAMKGFEKDASSRVVLVHNDKAVYNQLMNSGKMFDMLGLWFMHDGNQGLVQLQEKLAYVAAGTKRKRITCAG